MARLEKFALSFDVKHPSLLATVSKPNSLSLNTDAPSINAECDGGREIFDQIKDVGRGLDEKMHILNKKIFEAREILAEHQKSLENETSIERNLKRSFESTQNNVWRIKNLIIRKEELYQNLNKDMDKLTKESAAVESQCKIKALNKDRILRNNRIYQDKMTKREQLLENTEEVADLQRAEERLEELKTKRNSLKVVKVPNVEADGNYAHGPNVEELTFMISEENGKAASLHQAIQVLKKKTDAQKRRLLKQYRSEIVCQKNWSEKVDFLRQKIKAMQEELGSPEK